jgi:hypothetical protein
MQLSLGHRCLLFLLLVSYCHEFYEQCLFLQSELDRLIHLPPPAACFPEAATWMDSLWYTVGSDYREEDCQEYLHKLHRLPFPNPLSVLWEMLVKGFLHPIVPLADFFNLALTKLIRHHSTLIQTLLLVAVIPGVIGVLLTIAWFRRKQQRLEDKERYWLMEEKPPAPLLLV